MRVFVFLCGLLLMANVVLFLWPNPMQSAPSLQSAKNDVNEHFIRLNKEIESKYESTPSVTELVKLVAPEEKKDDAHNEAGLTCYRLGPFMYSANYELAKAVFFNAGVKYRSSTRQAKRSAAYRVYLGPFENKALAEDYRVELKRKGVLDNFLRKEDDGSYIISLGIYSTQKSVANALKLFNGKLESVKSKEESVKLPKSFWLFFAIDEQSKLSSQLQTTDWGEPSVVLGYYPCQSE